MATKYIVKKNDTLAKIAKSNGFRCIDTIIEANRDRWPYLSMHPNVLIEGMAIMIPEKKKKKLEQPSGTSVAYTVKNAVKQFIQLKIEDIHGEIVDVANDVQLMINGTAVPIQDLTDYNMPLVEFITIATLNPLPEADISSASLKLKLTSPLSGNILQKEIKLEIGGLDPFLDPQGDYTGKQSESLSLKISTQKILTNLGYYRGDLDGDLEKSESIAAIRGFQMDVMQMSPSDEDFGKPSINTCIRLGIQQGISLGPIQPIKYGQ